ncbi:MAG: hypothetical protein ACLBM7_02495 [Dolichospermum sp.]
MAYSDFSLTKFRNNFHISINEEADLFATVEPIEISEKLTNTLEETTELALAINTEKARSEMIITPILLEVRRKANYQISLFSGTDFNVDIERGLNGYCDFVISRSKEQLTINAPVPEVLNVKILRIVSKLCIGIGDTKFDQLMTLFSIDNGFYLGKTQRL